jgi:hypothetical protein
MKNTQKKNIIKILKRIKREKEKKQQQYLLA